MTVAALYIDPRGPYPKLLGPELCWDKVRDARTYAGPWPVVAHPPCSRWCQLAPLNQALHGYKVGDDDGCFASALAAVRTYGGALEHPAFTYAWRAHGLIDPIRGAWQRCIDGGWVTQVSQAVFGHRGRKLTWLYYFGAAAPETTDWSIPAHTAVVSSLTNHGSVNPNRLGPSEAKRSPVAFAKWLIALAEQAGKSRAA